jgi:Fic family protein
MDALTFKDTPDGHVVSVGGAHNAFIPNPLPPSIAWSDELILALSEADRALGQLAGLGRLLPNPHLLIRPFLHREAVLSSRIEGTRASLSDVFAYELNQPMLFELPSDTREVYNYVRALDYGMDRLRTLPLSLRLLREVHGVLMEGVRGDNQTPGEFRDRQNWIGASGSAVQDAIFVPPPTADMLQALDDLERYLHADSSLPPLVRIALIHYQLETIHPFLDGNGRVGRLLITLLLCAWDLLPEPLLYLSAYFERWRDAYTDLLFAVSERGAWQAWLEFFLQGIAVQAGDAVARTQRLQDLHLHYRNELQTGRTSARLLQVVDLLFARPLLTVRQVETALGCDYPAAQRYVEQLVKVGVLEEITGKVRNRVFRASQIIEAIDEPIEVGKGTPKLPQRTRGELPRYTVWE